MIGTGDDSTVRLTSLRSRLSAGVSLGRGPSLRRGPGSRSALLLSASLIALATLGLVLLVTAGLNTSRGQWIDQMLRLGASVPSDTFRLLQRGLEMVSIRRIAVAMVGVFAVGLAFRRGFPALFALFFIGGANVVTQVLKYVVIDRPALSFPGPNSLPSGHVTVLCSVTLALVFVVHARLRWLFVALASVAGTFAGIAVVVNNWHRPSDVLAAYLVCLLWAGVTLAAAVLSGRRTLADLPRRGWLTRFAGYVVVSGVACALVVGWLRLEGLTLSARHDTAWWGATSLFLMGGGAALLAAIVATAADHLGGRWAGPAAPEPAASEPAAPGPGPAAPEPSQ